MNKQTVIVIVTVAIGSFGLGWWLKPVPEAPAAQVAPNEMVQAEEEATPLTEMEQVALDFFIAAYIHVDEKKAKPFFINETTYLPENREPKKPGLVYVGTQKAVEENRELVYIFYPFTGDLNYIHLEKKDGEWKVEQYYDKSVGRGGDYTFEEFTQTERYQYLRVYEWKEAEAK